MQLQTINWLACGSLVCIGDILGACWWVVHGGVDRIFLFCGSYGCGWGMF